MTQSNDCLFCKIIQGEIPCKKAYENDHVLAFHDIRPQAPVHVLVIPKRHLSSVSELKLQDSVLLSELFLTANRLAQELKIDQTGYRLVINHGSQAGQTVFHLHLHLLGGRAMAWPPG
jgi:histidine triad (HIT) family protein